MSEQEAVVRALRAIAGMEAVLAGADHVDVKTVSGRCSLRRFLAGLFGYRPGWLTGLYRVRGVVARLMGLDHPADIAPERIVPEAIPMRRGEALRFLTVTEAAEDRYWIAEAADRHLRAWLCVLVNPLADGGKRFDVVTVVRYLHWTGPVYFNLIRPFHHLVVARMARAGVKG